MQNGYCRSGSIDFRLPQTGPRDAWGMDEQRALTHHNVPGKGARHAFDDLVQSAYAAAGSPARWRHFVEDCAKVLGADGMWLGHRSSEGKDDVEHHFGFENCWLESYDQHYQGLNPFAPALCRSPTGVVRHSDSLVPRRTAMHSSFANEWIIPQKYHVAATATVLSRRPRGMSLMGVYWHANRPESCIEGSIPLQQQLVGHLQSALGLHGRLRQLECMNENLLSALEASPLAVLLCDRHGVVLLATRSAEVLLSAKDGLTYSSGHVECTGGRASLLTLLIGEAARIAERKSRAVPRVIHVARPSGRPAYEVLLFPVTEDREVLRERGGRVLVFLSDPEGAFPPSTRVLRALYQLTETEARTVALLAAGESTARIAERLGVSRETAKSHLRAAFLKTDTHRQGELVSQVLSGLGRLQWQGTPDPAALSALLPYRGTEFDP